LVAETAIARFARRLDESMADSRTISQLGNTAWSLFFSFVWFMTVTHNPDTQIVDAHLRDEAFGG
jgi:hypothetical protein